MSQGIEYVEHWKAARGMRDLLNSQEMKAKRVAEAPFQTTFPREGSFEDAELRKSREGGARPRGYTASSRQ